MLLCTDFFSSPKAFSYLYRNIICALEEDGIDKTSNAIFSPTIIGKARIVAKSEMVVAGIHFIPYILSAMKELGYKDTEKCSYDIIHNDGTYLSVREDIAYFEGPLQLLLKAERVLLNYIIHLSGIATLTRKYTEALAGTKIQVLDTRKTIPGMRYPEKYAVRVGGGQNHRMDLEEMIMLRDIYIDFVGSLTEAVSKVRTCYGMECPPIAIECRDIKEVQEAILCKPERIMLDNMDSATLEEALSYIPTTITSEITGGITLENISKIINLPKHPDYISVGALTHSTQSADCSMYLIL